MQIKKIMKIVKVVNNIRGRFIFQPKEPLQIFKILPIDHKEFINPIYTKIATPDYLPSLFFCLFLFLL